MTSSVPVPALDLDEIEAAASTLAGCCERAHAFCGDGLRAHVASLVAEVKRLRDGLDAISESTRYTVGQIEAERDNARLEVERLRMLLDEDLVLVDEFVKVRAERDAARAALTRVEALCDEADARNWAKSHDVNGELFATVVGTGAVRAALAIPEPGEQPKEDKE